MLLLEFQERMIILEEWWSFAPKGDCVGNILSTSLHKYIRVTRGQDGVEIKSIIDLGLVKKDTLRYVQDVRTARGMGRVFSDHHVVLYKVRLVV